MAYRGKDLNLRSFVGRPWREPGEPAELSTNGGWVASARGRGEEPIFVDEGVIACCNAAHDAALFHGAREVGLEHLLYGLARLQAAADVLEQLGLRTVQLRRETAMAIAADVAASPISDTGAPRASAEYDEVLRRAADMARERPALASVSDVLRALLERGKSSPANALLVRAAIDPLALEQWRDDAWGGRGAAEIEAKLLRPQTGEAVLTRLDRLEGALRGLQTQMAADRQAIGEQLGDVQRAIKARPDAVASAHGSAAGDRLEAVAASVESKLDALKSSLAALSERAASRGEMSAHESWGDLVGAIEARIAAHTDEVGKALSGALSERLDQAAISVHRLEEGAAKSIAAGEEMQELRDKITAQLEASADNDKARADDLGEISAALVKLGTNQQTLGNNLNIWRLEHSGDVSIIGNRLEAMEKGVEDAMGRLKEDVGALREDIAALATRASTLRRWLPSGGAGVAPGWRERAASLRRALRRRKMVEGPDAGRPLPDRVDP
jgi:hypothetical protein